MVQLDGLCLENIIYIVHKRGSSVAYLGQGRSVSLISQPNKQPPLWGLLTYVKLT